HIRKLADYLDVPIYVFDDRRFYSTGRLVTEYEFCHSVAVQILDFSADVARGGLRELSERRQAAALKTAYGDAALLQQDCFVFLVTVKIPDVQGPKRPRYIRAPPRRSVLRQIRQPRQPIRTASGVRIRGLTLIEWHSLTPMESRI